MKPSKCPAMIGGALPVSSTARKYARVLGTQPWLIRPTAHTSQRPRNTCDSVSQSVTLMATPPHAQEHRLDVHVSQYSSDGLMCFTSAAQAVNEISQPMNDWPADAVPASANQDLMTGGGVVRHCTTTTTSWSRTTTVDGDRLKCLHTMRL